MSCTLHDVQLPQSASASITTWHSVAISWRRSTGAGLANVGFLYRLTLAPMLDEPLLDAVEEHVAARLGDVEQADGQPLQRRRTGEPCPFGDGPLAGRVENRACAHRVTSR